MTININLNVVGWVMYGLIIAWAFAMIALDEFRTPDDWFENLWAFLILVAILSYFFLAGYLVGRF